MIIMKQLSLVLNGILIIAVGVLFFLHLSGKAKTTEPTTVTTEQKTDSPPQKPAISLMLRSTHF